MRRQLVLGLIFIVVFLSFTLVMSTGVRLASITPPNFATTYPTNPFYNPSSGSTSFFAAYHQGGSLIASTFNWKIGGPDPITAYAYSGIYSVNQGTFQMPVGMAADNIPMPAQCFVGYYPVGYWNNCNAATWTVKLPPVLNDQCTGIPGNTGQCSTASGFDMKGTIVGGNGGILLTSATPVGDPTCTNYSGKPADNLATGSTCWSADYAIVQAAQAINPPCIQGATICLSTSPTVTNSNSSTVVNPTINGVLYNGYNCPLNQYNSIVAGNCIVTQLGTQTSMKTWYLYREITSLQLQIIPPPIIPNCVLGAAASCTNFGPSTSMSCGPNGAASPCYGENYFRPGIQSIINNEINKAAKLTNTRISFGLNVVGWGGLPCTVFDVSSGNCYYSIVGVWIGGQGVQTSGCTGVNTCAFVQGQHTQLPIFSDAGLSQPATVPPIDTLVNLAQLNNQTIASTIFANTYSQVFTYIDTQNLGVQYGYGGDANCTAGNLPGCIVTPTPLIVNVPLIYDIIGSKSLATWLYRYPGIPPSGGQSAGNVNGQVVDTNGNPIAGACVALSAYCSGGPGQIQKQTDGNGRFDLGGNIPVGTYSVYVSAPGFSNSIQTNVAVAIGALTTLKFVLVPLPSPGAGLSCLIPPGAYPNPIPFQPPITTPGIVCVPTWVIPASFILAALVVVALIAYSPAGSAFGFGFSAIAARRGRKR